MTEPKAEYVTETVTKSAPWHCVTDKHGDGCMARMGVMYFDPTRLQIERDGEIVAVIRGDAEIRCPECGKPQDWRYVFGQHKSQDGFEIK